MPKKSNNKAAKGTKDKATKLPENSKVVTGKVTATFVHLLEPDDYSGEDQWTVTAVIPKSDKKTVAKIKGAIAKATADAQAAGGKLNGVKQNKIKSPIKDGDKDFDTDEYPIYADSIVVTFKSNRPVKVIDRSKRQLTTDEEVYSGMLVAVSGAAYAYNVTGNAGIAFILGAVMKLEDGERIGGGGFNVDADFEEFIEEDEFDEAEDDEEEIDDNEEDEEDDDEEDEDDEEDDEDDDDEIDADTIKKLAAEVKEIKGGKKFLKELLAEYDVKAVSKLDEEDFADVAEELQEFIDENA